MGGVTFVGFMLIKTGQSSNPFVNGALISRRMLRSAPTRPGTPHNLTRASAYSEGLFDQLPDRPRTGGDRPLMRTPLVNFLCQFRGDADSNSRACSRRGASTLFCYLFILIFHNLMLTLGRADGKFPLPTGSNPSHGGTHGSGCCRAYSTSHRFYRREHIPIHSRCLQAVHRGPIRASAFGIPLSPSAGDYDSRLDHLSAILAAISRYLNTALEEVAANVPGPIDLSGIEALRADLVSEIVGALHKAAYLADAGGRR